MTQRARTTRPASVVSVARRAVAHGTTRHDLRAVADDLLREGAGVAAVGRLCPRCGSDGHGRPVARGVGAPAVSISYAAGLVLVAWSYDAPVGVDVEAAGADAGAYGDLTAWTHAEATLKALGTGLARDPATLAGDEAWTAPLDLGERWVATVALAGVDAARVVARG